jgi:hypothetical protein
LLASISCWRFTSRGSGTYTAEFKLDERTTFLRSVGTMDNEQGLIVERTIALRPFPALKLFHDDMYASLNDNLPPDVWDYPTP